jgi:hypothetical protein
VNALVINLLRRKLGLNRFSRFTVSQPLDSMPANFSGLPLQGSA